MFQESGFFQESSICTPIAATRATRTKRIFLRSLKQRLPADLILARTSDQPLQVKENIGLFMQSLYEAILLVVVAMFRGWLGQMGLGMPSAWWPYAVPAAVPNLPISDRIIRITPSAVRPPIEDPTANSA